MGNTKSTNIYKFNDYAAPLSLKTQNFFEEEAQIDGLLERWQTSHISILTQKFKEASTHTFGNFVSMSNTGFARLFVKLSSFFPEEITNNCFMVFNNGDRDKNNKMNFHQFCKMISVCALGNDLQRSSLLFDFFNTTDSPFMKKNELIRFYTYNFQFFTSVNSPLKLNNNQAKQIMLSKNRENEILIKLNRDYGISLPLYKEEFQKWVKKYFDIPLFFEEFFELIPNSYKEKKLIEEVLEQSCNENFAIKKVDKFYILSYKWWELWKMFVQKIIESNKSEGNKEKKNLEIMDDSSAMDLSSENNEQEIDENYLNRNLDDKISVSSIPEEINKIDQINRKLISKNLNDSDSFSQINNDSIFLRKFSTPIVMRKASSGEASQFGPENDGKVLIKNFNLSLTTEPNFNTIKGKIDFRQLKKKLKEEQNEIDKAEDYFRKGKRKDSFNFQNKPMIFQNIVHDIGDRPDSINNYELEGEYPGVLKKKLMLNHEFVLVPKGAWTQLISWYGGGPSFKRNSFPDERRGITIVDLYPIYCLCFKLKETLNIDYESKKSVMIDTIKNLAQAKAKMSKKLGIHDPENYVLYFKILGTQWTRLKSLTEKMKETKITDGTIFVFVKTETEQSFISRYIYKENEEEGSEEILKSTRKKEKKLNQLDDDDDDDDEDEDNDDNDDDNNGEEKKEGSQESASENVSFVKMFFLSIKSEVFNLDLGDFADIFHPDTEIWKAAALLDIGEDALKFHFPQESYKNDIWIPIEKIHDSIAQPFTLSKDKENNQKNFKLSKKYLYLTSKNKAFLNTYYPALNFLSNDSNTSYINAIVYILSHTPNFAEYFANNDFEKDLDKNYYNLSLFSAANYIKYTNTISEEFSFVLHDLYMKTQEEKIKMDDLIRQIRLHIPKFSGFEGFDVAEFFIELLNIFSEELSKKKTIRRTLCHTESNLISNESEGGSSKGFIKSSKLKNSMNELAGKDMDHIYEAFDNIDSIVRRNFLGKIRKHAICKTCKKGEISFEHFVMIPIKLPKTIMKYFEIIVFRNAREDYIPPLVKYSIKINRDASVKDLIEAFGKAASMDPSRFQIASIYQHKIQKILRVLNPVLIRKACLRERDYLVAYEIYNDYKKMIENLKNNVRHLEPPEKDKQEWKVEDLKKDDFVDVLAKNLSSREWKYGCIQDIMEVEEANGTKNLYFEIFYKDSRFRSYRTFSEWYKAKSEEVAPFRSKNLREDVVYVWQSINRKYNLENHGMEKFGLPFLLSVPHSLTWKELHMKIFEIVKRHLDFNYLAKKKIGLLVGEQGSLANLDQPSVKNLKILKKKPDSSINKVSNAMIAPSLTNIDKRQFPPPPKKSSIFLKIRKSSDENKNFISSLNDGLFNPAMNEVIEKMRNGLIDNIDELPYKIRLLDIHTERCLTCHKKIAPEVILIKGQIKIFQNHHNATSEKFCLCESIGLENKPVIFYVANPNHVLVCLDWIDINGFSNASLEPRLHTTVYELRKEKKKLKAGNTLKNCFAKFFDLPDAYHYCSSCQDYKQAMIRNSLWKLPNILVLELKRFKLSRNKYILKNQTPISFPIENLDLSQYISKNTQFIEVKDSKYELFAICNHKKDGYESYYSATILLENMNKEEEERKSDREQVRKSSRASNDSPGKNDLSEKMSFREKNWVLFEDKRIAFINDPRQIVSRDAYLLFYAKKGLRCKVNEDFILAERERKADELNEYY